MYVASVQGLPPSIENEVVGVVARDKRGENMFFCCRGDCDCIWNDLCSFLFSDTRHIYHLQLNL